MHGIYGNSKQEAMDPIDSVGVTPAFWSLTMYALPPSLLSAHPLNRYLLSSPMLP